MTYLVRGESGVGVTQEREPYEDIDGDAAPEDHQRPHHGLH